MCGETGVIDLLGIVERRRKSTLIEPVVTAIENGRA
jgi:hypothetical protein